MRGVIRSMAAEGGGGCQSRIKCQINEDLFIVYKLISGAGIRRVSQAGAKDREVSRQAMALSDSLTLQCG